MKKKPITIALDGTGGDRKSTQSIVRALNFAFVLYPALKVIVYGPGQLEADLLRKGVDPKRFEFRSAPQGIPQDEEPRRVLEGYRRAAMRQALESVKEGESQGMVSSGGTGPLVVLARHILGCPGHLRPALCARMPCGPGRFSLMLDLGANSSCTAHDLYDFARLGSAACSLTMGITEPRLAVLNVGREQGKGNPRVREARDLICADKNLYSDGFIEADRIFSGEADVIVTDGFTGNVALKAAEGVARIFNHATGLRRLFSKMMRPDWLVPWQYNGSILLGVDGVVVKSHASAGEEALAVAMVEAARYAEASAAEGIREILHLA